MRRAPRAEQPLRLLFDGPRPSYVCRACRQRTSKPPARQFHASAASSASGKPWITTIRESLFGSKNKAAAAPEEDRDLSASAANPEEYGVEITTDRRGNEYEVAQRVDPTRNKDYVVAHTWDGLESIGSEHWVRQRVDKGHQFEGFIRTKKVTLTLELLNAVLHHTAVELSALQQAGRDPAEICNPRRAGTVSRHLTRHARLTTTSGGEVNLDCGPTDATVQILDAISPTRKLQPRATVEGEEGAVDTAVESGNFEAMPIEEETEMLTAFALADPLEKHVQVDGRLPFLDIEFASPTLKLITVKRVMQLTGRRLSDPDISSISSFHDMRSKLKNKPKPKRLDQTREMEQVRRLSNVQVYAGRRTPIHKEMEIGRWKLIEEELVQRGLPVTGSRFPESRVTV